MKRRTRLIAVLTAALLTAAAAIGLFDSLDQRMADFLFQSPRSLSGEIVIIGIDEEALERFGPYQTWSRDIPAAALEVLGADPENAPAVVGLDTLYIGETDPEQDGRLVRAAEALGNVVVSSSAVFGQALVEGPDSSFYLDSYVVLSMDEPYDALKAVTCQGHVNAMYDTDGFLRHSILYVDAPDGRRIPSFSAQIAGLYRTARGEEPVAAPKTDERGHFYVSFSALPGDHYDGVSLADLIDGAVPPDYYAGKIVLIGPYAAGLRDTVRTPIDRAELMYGVEYHANVIQMLLEENTKWELPDPWQLACLLLLCFFAALFFYRRGLLPSTLVWLALSGGWLGAAVLLHGWGCILRPLWGPFCFTGLYLVSVAANYLRTALERRQVTQTFQRYVAPEIVAQILQGGTQALALGGKTCEIAVMFVDMRGFTALSERWAPEKAVSVLNRYLGAASAIIRKNSGTLDKFVGDAVMAFWGAPLPREDYIYLAAKTALEIVAEISRLSAELEEELGHRLQIGVGLHCGAAVVGNIGAQDRMDYTAIGDTVNTAARLESAAPGGTVYISRAVADALAGRAETTSLGTGIALKGKSAGFEVLTLDRLSAPSQEGGTKE